MIPCELEINHVMFIQQFPQHLPLSFLPRTLVPDEDFTEVDGGFTTVQLLLQQPRVVDVIHNYDALVGSNIRWQWGSHSYSCRPLGVVMLLLEYHPS